MTTLTLKDFSPDVPLDDIIASGLVMDLSKEDFSEWYALKEDLLKKSEEECRAVVRKYAQILAEKAIELYNKQKGPTKFYL